MSPLKQRILFIFIVILLNVSFVRVSSFPQNRAENGDANDSGSPIVENDNGDVGEMEIIMVDEIVRDSNVNLAKNSTVVAKAALIKPNNEASISSSSTFKSTPTASIQNDASNEPTLIDIADDLIFLEERPQQQHDMDEAKLVKERKIQQQQQKQRSTTLATLSSSSSTSSVGTFQQIDLLTSAEEDSLTAISSSTTATAASKSNEAQDYVAKAVGGGGGDDDGVGASTTTSPIKHVIADKEVGGIAVDEDEVSLDESDDDDDVATADLVAIAPVTAATPIDMSDFVALIPVGAVKTIVTNYYRNDPEVQRAYAYLSSPDFVVVRQHIIVLPEVQAFLRYLNSSGLDVMGFLSTITNLTRKPDALAITTKTLEDNFTDEDIGSGSDAVMANEIDNGNRLNQQSTSQQAADSTANTEEPAQGLHGLVDSVLEVLPQDQILATFFDKLESNEQFTRLVDNIGQPAFAKILHNLQNSAQLRTLVFTLHNHGIYVGKIVESLKAYFFLGTF